MGPTKKQSAGLKIWIRETKRPRDARLVRCSCSYFGRITIFRCCRPHSTITSTTFLKDLPEEVSSYSTVTGIVLYTFRCTIPFSSSSFNSFDSMRGVILGISRSSSLNRLLP